MPWLKLILFIVIGLSVSVNLQALVVLQYHHISDQASISTRISPALFEQHLVYLAANKFRILDPKTLFDMLRKGQKLPDHSVVITFDDGAESVYSEAFMRLRERKWPFAVFINSRAHDVKAPAYMSWQQIKEMSKAGVVFVNHTDSHLHMIRAYPGESTDDLQQRRIDEVRFAEKRIQQETAQSHKVLAYPYGEYDSELQRQLAKEGYIAFGQQSGPVPDGVDKQLIPRFPVGGRYGDMADFAIKVNSMAVPFLTVRVENERGQLLSDPELPQGTVRPILTFSSPVMPYLAEFTCYASGQGQISAHKHGQALVVQALLPLPVGRSRYNCTAAVGNGRFYWVSHMFIRRGIGGGWQHN